MAPRVVWSPRSNTFLIAWIDAAADVAEPLSVHPSGTLKYAIFDHEYRPSGTPSSSIDEDVSRFDVTEVDGDFSVVYAHANREGQADYIISRVQIDAAGTIQGRSRVTETNGTIVALATSSANEGQFLATWIEQDSGGGSQCGGPNLSCILNSVMERRAGDIGPFFMADMTPGTYVGMDVAMGPSGGIVVATARELDPARGELIWMTVDTQFRVGMFNTLLIDEAELTDPEIDPGVRVAVQANGDYVAVRTRGGQNPRAFAHVISESGNHEFSQILESDTNGLRDVSVAKVQDPMQGGVTAWPTAEGIKFTLWGTQFDLPRRTHTYLPLANPTFDHRPVDIATAPGVGYVVAVAGPSPSGPQISFSFLGPDLDRLCGPPPD